MMPWVPVGCVGKQGFLSWEQANRTLGRERFKPAKKAGRGRIAIYRCRVCSFWHIGASMLNDKKAGQ